MTGSNDDRLRTGGAFDALANYQSNLESKLRGSVLGGYKVERVIGSGGMGYVFLATRAEADFDRLAAIKVVVEAHATSEFAQRFRTEVRILAQLNHACIAQLYDAGETEEGWPYLIMEYVDGSPIDEHCSVNNLAIDERVRLLIDVVLAVQFAHAQLIVHRDLKPSNVFVDKSGQLKLLDFGIAKLLSDTPEDLTRAGAMTPKYASPEQLLGRPISIATDIYQLGLLMAKVLGGSLPNEQELLTDAIQRSAHGRLLTLTPSQRQSLPNEIVLIIEQCLRTDPTDRYRDASSLHDDLQAYLSGHPVSAAGQNRAYRMRKFVRRNWAGVSAAALTILTLIVAMVMTAMQMFEANRQRDIAVYQQQRVQASSEFYSLLMEEMGGSSFTSIDLLDRGRELLQDQFGLGQPFMSSVLFDVSRRYASLGEQDRETELLREAEGIARQHGDQNMLAAILCSMARNNQVRAPELAAQQRLEGTALYTSLTNPAIETSMACLRAQAGVEIKTGNVDAALITLFTAKGLLEHHPSSGTNLRAQLLNDIASAYFYDGKPTQAIENLDQALGLLESTGRGTTLGYQRIAANKAVALQVSGRTPEALAAFVEVRRLMLTSGFRDRGAVVQLAQYGDLLMGVDRVDEAEAIYNEGLVLAESTGNRRIAAALNLGLAKVHIANKDYALAHRSLDAAQMFVHQGEPRPLALGIRNHRVMLHRSTGNLDLAVTEIDALLSDVGYPGARRGTGLTAALKEAASVYQYVGDLAGALVLVDGLIERLRERVSADSPGNLDLGKALVLRAEIRLVSDHGSSALVDLNEALPHLVYALGEHHQLVEKTRSRLADIR